MCPARVTAHTDLAKRSRTLVTAEHCVTDTYAFEQRFLKESPVSFISISHVVQSWIMRARISAISHVSENQEARASRAASRCAISSIFRRIASMGDRSSTELVSAKASAGALPIASSSSKAERKPAYASCAPPSLRMTSSVSC